MPTINDRIGSQNVIRVLSNASAPPSRVNNLLDINAGRKDDTDATGLLLIWDKTSAKYILGNDIAHGLNITGLTTFTRLKATGVEFTGVTTAATLSATTAISMGSTSVISAARQLQNIASLDATTTATIESAISNAPNTFTDLQVSGISTFVGASIFNSVATFNVGANVVAGVSTFAAAIDANAGANIAGGLVADTAKISDLTQANAIVFSGSDGELVETSAFTINSVSETLIGQNFTGTSLSASRQFTAALLNVTGVSTFAGISTFNNNVFVEATTDTNQLNVTGVSTFVGNVKFDGNVSIAGTLTYEDVTNVDSVGIVTAGKGVRVTTGGIVVTAGVSTYGAAIDANAGADISGGVGLNVVGHTELDNVNVSGVSTFVGVSTFSGDVYVGGDLYLKDDLVLDNITGSSLKITGISTFDGAIDANAGADISGGVGLNVVGHTEVDNFNASGVSTFAALVDGNAGANFSGAETTLSSATVSDLTSGRITYAGASGSLQDSGNLTYIGSKLTVTGNAQVTTDLDVDGGADISGGVGLNVVGHTELDNLNVSGVSTFAALLDANLGLNVSGGTGFVASTAKISDLTSGRVVYSGASGELQDSANLTFDGTELSAGLIDGGSY